jgi:hypothetical protein
MSEQIKDGGQMSVLSQVRSWLPFDGDDDNIRQKFDDHCAAVAELIGTNQRIAHHLANAVQFIEQQYPNARQLDRGPIMRNMRRWRDQLTTALARVGGAK